MDIARFAVDIAHFETTTTYTAIFIRFFQILNYFFRPLLRKVSWDLFFGAWHFCSFDIADLEDFTPKFPEKISF